MTEPNRSDHVPWWRRLPKVFITRSILLCIGVVAVFCLAIALAHFDLNLYAVRGQNNNYSQGDVFGELAVAAVSLSVATSAFFFFQFIAGPPLHPGYYVAGDMLSFLTLTVCLTIGFMLSAFTTFNNFVEESTCQSGFQWARCVAEADIIQQLELVGYSCGFVTIPLHFTLFVIACYRTHVHNLRKEMSKITAEMTRQNLEMRMQDLEMRRYPPAKAGKGQLPRHPAHGLSTKKKLSRTYKAELDDSDRREELQETR